jgi:glutamine amidotransferase-like uncharacterized protein
MKTIYVYQDYVHNNGVLFRRLTETFGQNMVCYCDADDILKGCLSPEKVAMFVMPGGADLFFCEKLNGKGNDAIRSYVEQGGTYFGICAGAYYACSRIEWAEDDTINSICGERELNFFKGTARGPLYQLLENGDITKSWDNIARLDTARGPRVAFYNAGPVFIADKDSYHDTLASYASIEGTPAALVDIEVGQGRAVLSSCHIEYTPVTLKLKHYIHRNASHAWSQDIIKIFEQNWTPQTDLWNEIVPSLIQDPVQKVA